LVRLFHFACLQLVAVALGENMQTFYGVVLPIFILYICSFDFLLLSVGVVCKIPCFLLLGRESHIFSTVVVPFFFHVCR